MKQTEARAIHKSPQRRTASSPKSNTLEKIAIGGIGSFLLVLLFPRGVRYFFKNMFAEIVAAIVSIILAGLLTEKLFNKISQNKKG